MGAELVEAGVKAAEREAVAREDQRVGGGAGLQGGEGGEKVAQRVALGLEGQDGDVGVMRSITWSVARRRFSGGGVEEELLGGVALAGQDLPAAGAEREGVAGGEAAEAAGRDGQALEVAVALGDHRLRGVGRQAVGGVEAGVFVGFEEAGRVDEGGGEEEGGAAGPEGHAEPLAEPAREGPMWSGWWWVTSRAWTGPIPGRSASQAALVASSAMPASTRTQPEGSSMAKTLTWSRRKGSGRRAQRRPGAASTQVPGAGGAAKGRWSGDAPWAASALMAGRHGLLLPREPGGIAAVEEGADAVARLRGLPADDESLDAVLDGLGGDGPGEVVDEALGVGHGAGGAGEESLDLLLDGGGEGVGRDDAGEEAQGARLLRVEAAGGSMRRRAAGAPMRAST
jgi:hypothetical protein